jgi:hypothetical protein
MTVPLRLVFIGLSITSSWGNGHATTYRSLLAALARRGHLVHFLERDVPWYASHRDQVAIRGVQVSLYGSLDELRDNAWIREIESAPAPDEDRGHRRWFRITPQGRRALAAELERMQSLVTVAQRRLAGAGESS